MGIQVISAIYGPAAAGGIGVDVTAACQTLVDSGQDDIYVWPSTFGISDPDPNVQKTFGILYTYNSNNQTCFGVDGTTLDLAQ